MIEFLFDTVPVVKTEKGKIRGYKYAGVYTFKGIPYARAGRFQAPREIGEWSGEMEAVSYGCVCPLLKTERPVNELLVPHRYWIQDENCQNLNIWTPVLDPEAKLPVLVWIHGGGYEAGSSIEQKVYNGSNLSKAGPMVVVSVNHRLNILGYLDLSFCGARYDNSGNAGQMDLIAALKWIRENIRSFGGNPENVTLMGQSGGGGKISALLQTPAADGLYHKAVIMSGILNNIMPPQHGDGRRIVKAMLDRLGLGDGDVSRLETLPYPALAQAYLCAKKEVEEDGGYVGNVPLVNSFFPGDAMEVGFTEQARRIPLMVGTTFGELLSQLPEECLRGAYRSGSDGLQPGYMTDKQAGDVDKKILHLFKQAYPDKKTEDLLWLDSWGFRLPSRKYVLAKASCSKAPVYSYIFTFNFSYHGSRPAWHCSELPFVFRNLEKAPISNIPEISECIQERFSRAIVSFAYSGNPSHRGLPEWKACMPGHENIMILDEKCEMKQDFDSKLIELHAGVMPESVRRYSAGKTEYTQH